MTKYRIWSWIVSTSRKQSLFPKSFRAFFSWKRPRAFQLPARLNCSPKAKMNARRAPRMHGLYIDLSSFINPGPPFREPEIQIARYAMLISLPAWLICGIYADAFAAPRHISHLISTNCEAHLDLWRSECAWFETPRVLFLKLREKKKNKKKTVNYVWRVNVGVVRRVTTFRHCEILRFIVTRDSVAF